MIEKRPQYAYNIAFQDTDDEWLPDKLLIQVNALLESDQMDFPLRSHARPSGP